MIGDLLGYTFFTVDNFLLDIDIIPRIGCKNDSMAHCFDILALASIWNPLQFCLTISNYRLNTICMSTWRLFLQVI